MEKSNPTSNSIKCNLQNASENPWIPEKTLWDIPQDIVEAIHDVSTEEIDKKHIGEILG